MLIRRLMAKRNISLTDPPQGPPQKRRTALVFYFDFIQSLSQLKPSVLHFQPQRAFHALRLEEELEQYRTFPHKDLSLWREPPARIHVQSRCVRPR